MISKSIKLLAAGIMCWPTISACGVQGLDVGSKTGQANATMEAGNYKDAEAEYNEALDLIAKHEKGHDLSDNTTAVLKAHVLAKIGTLFTKEKRYDEATSKFKEAIKLFDDTPDLTSTARENMVECLKNYASLLRLENKTAEAAQMDDRAAKVKP